MKTLFSDIYNKIMELFQIEKSENTSKCATNRLQVILMHDRTKLDPLIMNKMREELIDVFSKYVVIDKEELEIGLKNEGDAVALMLNIPIVRAKTEEELEQIRKKLIEEEDKAKNASNEIIDDSEKIVEGEISEIEETIVNCETNDEEDVIVEEISDCETDEPVNENSEMTEEEKTE